MKKLIVFDLDGTLAESKSPLDAEMSRLLHGRYLPPGQSLANLSLLSTCGTKFFSYTGEWKKLYSEDFTLAEKAKIGASLKKAVAEAAFQVERVWGEVIEDRGSQIAFSALGKQAPLEQKEKWTPISPSEKGSRRSLTS
jgi:phosphomannomutase